MIEIIDLNHVTLVVRDLAASRHFYCEILGMQEVPRPPAAQYDIAWVRKGSAELHLIHKSESPQEPGDAPAQHPPDRDVSLVRHLALAVQDTDEVVRVLGRHRIPIVLGPRPRGDDAIQVFCFDPDGHLVELHTLPDALER
jgi:catechol 2,3-dioxygenase-like lactoylglutathione lyase family enzyme